MTDGNKKYELNIWSSAKKDLRALDGSQLVFVKKGLERIAVQGLSCGQALHGSLEGWRKLKNRKMGLRIVFGQDPKTGRIDVVDVIAIGKREKSRVYQVALERIQNKRKS
ncbi:type II toxin-antitoxin system RelE family toxin [Lactobacillus sp.]|uniref:type II toxin-antitoxin system RelE family toxin n=1 Tax=Lactobacillus sp. TaxID=1591 RepID=UPI003EF0F84A